MGENGDSSTPSLSPNQEIGQGLRIKIYVGKVGEGILILVPRCHFLPRKAIKLPCEIL